MTTYKFEGSKYRETQDMDLADIAKLVRKEIRDRTKKGDLPKGLKVSVRISRFSGGQSMDLTIKELPGMVIANPERVRAEMDDPHGHHPIPYMSEEADEVRKKVEGIAQQYNFDDSDSMTDYFHNRFYCRAELGGGLLDESRKELEAKFNDPQVQEVLQAVGHFQRGLIHAHVRGDMGNRAAEALARGFSVVYNEHLHALQNEERAPTKSTCADCRVRPAVVGCARCGESICRSCVAEVDADGGSYCASCMISLQEPEADEYCTCGDGQTKKVGNAIVCAACGAPKRNEPDCSECSWQAPTCKDCKHDDDRPRCENCGEPCDSPSDSCLCKDCEAQAGAGPVDDGDPKALQDGQGRWWVFVPGADDEGRGVMNGPYDKDRAQTRARYLMERVQELRAINRARDAVVSAIARLNELADLHRKDKRWSHAETIAHYLKYLEETWTCDDGEAGLAAYLKEREDEISRG